MAVWLLPFCSRVASVAWATSKVQETDYRKKSWSAFILLPLSESFNLYSFSQGRPILLLSTPLPQRCWISQFVECFCFAYAWFNFVFPVQAKLHGSRPPLILLPDAILFHDNGYTTHV